MNGLNLSRNWRVIIDNWPQKQLRRIPTNDASRISQAIDEMEINPFAGDIQKIGGEETAWRRRVGNYRILFDIYADRKIVDITDIDRRTSKSYEYHRR